MIYRKGKEHEKKNNLNPGIFAANGSQNFLIASKGELTADIA